MQYPLRGWQGIHTGTDGCSAYHHWWMHMGVNTAYCITPWVSEMNSRLTFNSTTPNATGGDDNGNPPEGWYKEAELVVEAFNILKLPLHIVGSGSMVSNLKKSAGQNINFHHNISDKKLDDLYAKSYAVIFPHKCEYGLVPLESNAMGKPAICYGFGGATETMIAFDGKNNNIATSIFFYEQTVDSLIKAVNKFMKVNFKRETLLENARKFDKLSFQNKISEVLNIVN